MDRSQRDKEWKVRTNKPKTHPCMNQTRKGHPKASCGLEGRQPRGSEAHLSAPQVRQILLGRTTLEVDFEVHGGEVWG